MGTFIRWREIMKKKALFILLPFYMEHGGREQLCPTMPYGVLSIAHYIKDVAEVKIFDCSLHDEYQDVLKDVLVDFNPDIIGFNMMYDSNFLYLHELSEIVKELKPDASIFLGGAATPYVYSELIDRLPLIDAICYRDGEIPLRHFILTGELNEAWITKKDDVPKKIMVENLDELIDIDYSLININDYQSKLIAENFSPFVEPDKAVQLYTMGSRGCNFSCTFCTNSKNPDKKLRHATPSVVVDHVGRLIEEYEINVLSLYDEQLLKNREWAKELFKGLAKYDLIIKIPGGITPMYVDEEMADLMWEAGVDAVGLAIESGSKKVLRLMRKPVNLDQCREVMKYFRKHNFFIRAFLVLGIPGETDEDRKMSLDFIREIQPDVISPNIASPILGSRLRDECIKKGYIKTAELGYYNRMTPFIDTPEYSAEYIEEQFKWMNWDINFVNNYRMKIGDYESARRYFRYVADKYPHEAFAWYYLGLAMQKLGETPNWKPLYECIHNDLKWRERFAKFGVKI